MYAKTTQDVVRQAVATVSERWDGNVILENIVQRSTNYVSFKIGTRDSKAAGSRRSWSGRHGRWACTHVFADVMQEILNLDSEAVFKRLNTGIEVFDQASLNQHVDQAEHCNVGSLFQPAYLVELCYEPGDDFCDSRIFGQVEQYA